MILLFLSKTGSYTAYFPQNCGCYVMWLCVCLNSLSKALSIFNTTNNISKRGTSKAYLSYVRIIKYCTNRLHNFITINHFHLTHGTVGMYNKAFHTLISQNNFYRGLTMHSLISRLNFIYVKLKKRNCRQR